MEERLEPQRRLVIVAVEKLMKLEAGPVAPKWWDCPCFAVGLQGLFAADVAVEPAEPLLAPAEHELVPTKKK